MTQSHRKSSNANRGMDFEKLLNDTNKYYIENDIAVIHKKPTPIRVINFSNGYITKAVYDKKSTTDFSGVYNKKAIDFEAKETKSKRFNFSNIKKHQIEHLIMCKKHGGIAFVLVYYSLEDRCFLLEIDELLELKKAFKSVGIKELSNEVEVSYIVDYLKVVGDL